MHEEITMALLSIKNSVMINVFVFVMMLIVDYLNVLTKGRMSSGLKEKRFFEGSKSTSLYHNYY
jgi:hypothetical protein